MPEQSVSERVAHVYSRESTDARVIVADGFGVKITTERGHLVIKDGIGPYRRERRIPRIGSPVERIAILTDTGYITLGALKWCHELGIQVMQLNRDGELIMSGRDIRSGDPKLVRAQAINDGLAITRYLLEMKLMGQAKVLYDFLDAPDSGAALEKSVAALTNAATIDLLRMCEARAANTYFNAWSGRVAIRWDRESKSCVPAHWREYGNRKSELSGGKRHASDPVNAMLNYAYALGYASARIACLSVGLDPRLGYLHADNETRDSLALDILETIRPDIDRDVLKLINTRYMSRHVFTELPNGQCRLVAPLTHELCELSLSWAGKLQETAQNVVRLLLGARPRQTRPVRRSERAHADHALIASLVPDKVWQVVKRELPPAVTAVSGRNAVNDRIVLAAIIYRIRNEIAWNDIPKRLGVHGSAARKKWAAWHDDGTWSHIENYLDL